MKRKEFVDQLSNYLEADNFSDYCPNGLQIEGAGDVKSVATAVSANRLTIEAAIKAGVDTLVVHHGLFWVNDPYPIIGPKKEKIEKLFNAGINLLGYHLPLDAHQQVGNNWKAAKDLGWRDLEPACEIGVKGKFDALPIEQFVQKMEGYYAHPAASALFGKKEVTSAALVSGGAWRQMLDHDCDIFITGNFDEPAFGWAEEHGKHFLALGHSATEEVGPKALAEYIKNTLKLECQFLEIKNPF